MKQKNDDGPDAANHHPTSVVMIIITKTRTNTNPSHAPHLWRKGSADLRFKAWRFLMSDASHRQSRNLQPGLCHPLWPLPPLTAFANAWYWVVGCHRYDSQHSSRDCYGLVLRMVPNLCGFKGKPKAKPLFGGGVPQTKTHSGVQTTTKPMEVIVYLRIAIHSANGG